MSKEWRFLKMKIEYSEIDIDTVMEYFKKDFKDQKGNIISRVDWFYDSNKGKVIFKLYIEGVK